MTADLIVGQDGHASAVLFHKRDAAGFQIYLFLQLSNKITLIRVNKVLNQLASK